MLPTVDLGVVGDEGAGLGDDEFELDLRVVEATTPIVEMMCNTNDGCGNTCSTSACNSRVNDPF